MIIEGFKDKNDNRYYIPTKIQSSTTNLVCSINFLIDTGASTTSISWNDAMENSILYKYLNEHPRRGGGLGYGKIIKYILPNISIFFPTTKGKYWYYDAQNILIMDHETTKKNQCLPHPSLLGIDIINQFELRIKDNKALLMK